MNKGIYIQDRHTNQRIQISKRVQKIHALTVKKTKCNITTIHT